MGQFEPFLVTLDTNAVLALANDEADAPAVRELIDLQQRGVIKLRLDLSVALEKQRPGARYNLGVVADLRALGFGDAEYFAGPRSIAFGVDGQPNTTVWDMGLEQAVVRRIHEIIHPCLKIPFSWPDYLRAKCQQDGIALEDIEEATWDLRYRFVLFPPAAPPESLDPMRKQELRDRWHVLHTKWMNAKNDALSLYNHVTWNGAVFVTSDQDFLKRRAALRRIDLQVMSMVLAPDGVIEYQPRTVYFQMTSEISRPVEAVAYIRQKIQAATS